MFALTLISVLAMAASYPAAAHAHGPVAPVALDYLARITRLPPGIDAKVVDGDQRMWLRVAPGKTAVVLDYRGAPYVWFSRAGVQVNHNSAMYYLNETPFAGMPPANLGPHTPPKWEKVAGGRSYGWHDGRLHALATVALRPGQSFVGRWTVPIVVDGRLSVISGTLWHAGPPSVVWFWPIGVILLCVLAGWRVKSPGLDRWMARLLALAALGAVAAAGVGRELHGRPSVSVLQLIELGLILAFVLWGLVRVVAQRPGFLTYFVIAMAALWEGLELIPTLTNGFVLIAIPALVARVAAVLALATPAGLMLMVFRIYDQGPQAPSSRPEPVVAEDADAWELA